MLVSPGASDVTEDLLLIEPPSDPAAALPFLAPGEHPRPDLAVVGFGFSRSELRPANARGLGEGFILGAAILSEDGEDCLRFPPEPPVGQRPFLIEPPGDLFA